MYLEIRKIEIVRTQKKDGVVWAHTPGGMGTLGMS